MISFIMLKNLKLITVIVLVDSILTAEVESNSKCNQINFNLKAFGYLANRNKVLFTAKGKSRGDAINHCSKFCFGDRRCIGMEICKISDGFYLCRGCCQLMIKSEEQYLTNSDCRYFQKDEGHFQNVAVDKPATMISAYNPDYHFASKAVDNVTVCPIGLSLAHTGREIRPWIKIDLQSTYDVQRVLIYNRQDRHGADLHDLLISVGDTGTENVCGVFEGPGQDGDEILIFCTFNTIGRYVMATIISKPGETDLMQVCEVQVFVQS